MAITMAKGLCLSLAAFGALIAIGGTGKAQPEGLSIEWEVVNRFRLFAAKADFETHVEAIRTTGKTSVLAIEQHLAKQDLANTDKGRGWADTVKALCVDSWSGQIKYQCERDGREENYLNPTDALVKLRAQLPGSFGDATCEWTVGAERTSSNCKEIIERRLSTRTPTQVSLVARNPPGSILQASTEIQVRDIFIVGLGDSIAAGEGNPTQPISLSDAGFCFRSLSGLPTRQFYLPGRKNVGPQVKVDCHNSPDSEEWDAWDAARAGWLYSACHRSLYSYQTRTALALALENKQVSVTFLPLGCTGAEIGEGLIENQRARERPKQNGNSGPKHPRDIEGQIKQLQNLHIKAAKRPIDLILLTIGANDIGFSGLVGDIMINGRRIRGFARANKMIVTPDGAREKMKGKLRRDFAELRTKLSSFTGGTLERVVFTTYGNPATYDGGIACPGTRKGFDSHPAFSMNADRLKNTVDFVNNEFLPTLKSYVTFGAGGGCRAASQTMTYVDGHQKDFADHGFCAAGTNDPVFDQQCFLDGNSFNPERVVAMKKPMVCNHRPSSFRAYAPRARWVRTVNDTYFAAMTYPVMKGPLSNPINIHDALWGLEAGVFGGAIHPTAEGHAAMADAALIAARKLLKLPSPTAPMPSN